MSYRIKTPDEIEVEKHMDKLFSGKTNSKTGSKIIPNYPKNGRKMQNVGKS